jgi:hypothetical protein
LNVAGEELGSGQQTADSAHMVVTVTMNPVADSIQDQRLIFKRLQRLETRLQLEVAADLIGPKRAGNDAIGAEDDDEALLSPARESGNRRKVGHERQSRRSNAEVT